MECITPNLGFGLGIGLGLGAAVVLGFMILTSMEQEPEGGVGWLPSYESLSGVGQDYETVVKPLVERGIRF